MLLQEARRPHDIPDGWRVHPSTSDWTTAGRQPEMTTAIVCTDPQLRFESIEPPSLPEAALTNGALVRTSQPGVFALAEVQLVDAEPVVLVSAYGLLEGPTGNATSHTTLHRLVSDLELLIKLDPRGRRMVLGGDLNSGTQPYDRYTSDHEFLWQRVANVGFRNLLADFAQGPLEGCSCNLGGDCRHVRTEQFRGDSPRPWGVDYILAQPTLEARDCRALNDIPDDTWVSDHCPVVAELVV